MARMPRRGHDARSRLRFETLESRRLLTLAAFNVNLYRDVDGVPGALIAGDTVEVGESFFVEITAQDVQAEPEGIHGIALDFVWNPQVLTEIDASFTPQQLITPKLPAFQLGKLDNPAGRIENLSGSAFLSGALVGKNGPERFALLHFQALAPATDSLFVVDPGRSGIAIFPHFWPTHADFAFEPQTITVVAPAEDADDNPVTLHDTPLAPIAEPPAPLPPPVSTPTFELQVYQGAAGLIQADQVDELQPFYAEIVADPPASESIPLSSFEALDDWLAGGKLSLTRLQVDCEQSSIDLPLVASPVDPAASVPTGTHVMGFTYLPPAATAAVFASAPTDDLVATAIPTLDDGLMQALISGLAIAKAKDTRNPFCANSD